MNTKTAIFILIALVLAGGAWIFFSKNGPSEGTSPGAAYPEQPVRIGRMSLSYPHAPAALLDRMGILEKHGITNYEIKTFSKGSDGSLALGSGAVDIIMYGAAIPPIVEGLEANIIAMNNAGGVKVVCMEPGVETLEDLRGMTVGNIGPTASPTTIFGMALAKAGIPRDAIRHRYINRTSIVPAMTEEGIVDCFVAMEPLSLEAVKRGAYVAIDEKEIYGDGSYPLSFVSAREAYIEQHRDVVDAVLAAHREAQQFIERNPEETIAIMGEYFSDQGVSMSEDDLRTGLSANSFPQNISREVMEDMLGAMVEGGTIARAIPFDEFVDCSFGLCTE